LSLETCGVGLESQAPRLRPAARFLAETCLLYENKAKHAGFRNFRDI
jgi:hypothetical protein